MKRKAAENITPASFYGPRRRIHRNAMQSRGGQVLDLTLHNQAAINMRRQQGISMSRIWGRNAAVRGELFQAVARRGAARGAARLAARGAATYINPYLGAAITAADIGYQAYKYLKPDAIGEGQLGPITMKQPGQRTAAVKTKGDVDKKNRKKAVKVSSNLRKQIKSVVEDLKYTGSWQQYSYGFLDRPGSSSQLSQNIQQPVNPDFLVATQFSADELLHMASVLFNEKNDSQFVRNWDNIQNIGITNGSETAPKETETFACNAKFTVKDSFCIYKLRNNTQNQVKIYAYICSPKQQGNVGIDARSNQGALFSFQYAQVMDGLTVWQQALADKTGQNLATATTNNLGARPDSCANFRKYFSTETKTIVMEPGQEHTFSVQGPKNQQLNYRKFFKGNLFHSIQKFSRCIFFSVESDLLSGNGGDINKIGRFKTTSLGNIVVEIEQRVKIGMPETTGLKAAPTIAGGPIELNLRKSSFFLKTYDTATPSTLLRYDEVQPATPIS